MNTDDIYREIGGNIKDARKAREMSQEDLARAVGFLRTSIVNIEQGRQRVPLDTLIRIAAALDVHPSLILPVALRTDTGPRPIDDSPLVEALIRIAALERRLARIANIAALDPPAAR